MIFNDLELLDSFEVEIMENSYLFLMSLTHNKVSAEESVKQDFLVNQRDVVEMYYVINGNIE